jgi:hypothetical protein
MDSDGTVRLVGAILRGTPSLPGAACAAGTACREVPVTAAAVRQE